MQAHTCTMISVLALNYAIVVLRKQSKRGIHTIIIINVIVIIIIIIVIVVVIIRVNILGVRAHYSDGRIRQTIDSLTRCCIICYLCH